MQIDGAGPFGKREIRQFLESVNTYHLRERRFGRFARTINFPSNVDSEHVQATLENGVLMLHIPKAAESKPRRIEVKGGAPQQSQKIESPSANS